MQKQKNTTLTPLSLRSKLATHVVGSRIIVRQRAASTMDLAADFLSRGYPEGTVVFALEQSAGRGRFGARWWSPPGAGLLFSVALSPKSPRESAALLTFMGAVCVAEVLRRAHGLDARIRWPNDVVVGGRKIAGVLVEMKRLGRLRPIAVLGIGLNLNIRRQDLPHALSAAATSVLAETRRRHDPLRAARALLRGLDRWYARLHDEGAQPLLRKWCRLSSTLGKRVLLNERGRAHRGVVMRITPAGELVVRLDTGPTRAFRAERTRLVSEEDGSAVAAAAPFGAQ